MTVMRPVDGLARATSLDPIARPLTAFAQKLPQHWRNLLHGTWLGHPLHPALAYVPVGSWISAAVLDSVALRLPKDQRGGLEDASTLLVGVGLAGVPAAAAAGLVDWSDLHQDQQRIGLVHASMNVVAGGLLGASWLLRRRGRHGWGRVLGFAGTSVGGVSAAVGGHLSFHWAAGANHAQQIPHVTGDGWHAIERIEVLPDGELSRRMVGDTPVVVLRRGSDVQILADACSHLAGPLSEGELVQKDDGDCVVCPWHGSTFRFSDGGVVTGPATADQPRFEVRLEGGMVSARILSS